VTRPERSYKRHLQFNDWIRANLIDSSRGLLVTDIDFVFINPKRKVLMLLEVKQKNNYPRPFQLNLFMLLDMIIRKGIADSGYDYLGFHVLRFENTFWDDGKVWYDEKEITESEFKTMMNNFFG
jgi:hypothetical protein